MKLLPLAVVVFAATYSVLGQERIPYVPCLVDVQDHSKQIPGEPRRPNWQAPKAKPFVYKIGGGGSWQIPIVMPVAGKCAGSFEAYDDRDDVAVAVVDALGRYIKKQPPGDIEILIVDEAGFAAMNRGQNYVAYYSSGRQFAGIFDVPLAAGFYRLVISNRHSLLARKSVRFALGRS